MTQIDNSSTSASEQTSSPRPVLIRHCGLCGHAFVQRPRSKPGRPESAARREMHDALRSAPAVESEWASSPSCPHCGHAQTTILDSAPTMAHAIDRARRLSAISRGGAAEAVALAAESAELLPTVDPALASSRAAG